VFLKLAILGSDGYINRSGYSCKPSHRYCRYWWALQLDVLRRRGRRNNPICRSVGQSGGWPGTTALPTADVQLSPADNPTARDPQESTAHDCMGVRSSRTVILGAEADLGIFNMFGRTGVPTKMGHTGQRMSDGSATFLDCESLFMACCDIQKFAFGALEVNFNAMRSINSRFTYLLTYFAARHSLAWGVRRIAKSELYDVTYLYIYWRENYVRSPHLYEQAQWV